jgi:hypothetical protein
LGCYRLIFIVLAGKLAAGHKNKHRNPHCICLVTYFSKHYQSQKHSPGSKIWVPIDFF